MPQVGKLVGFAERKQRASRRDGNPANEQPREKEREHADKQLRQALVSSLMATVVDNDKGQTRAASEKLWRRTVHVHMKQMGARSEKRTRFLDDSYIFYADLLAQLEKSKHSNSAASLTARLCCFMALGDLARYQGKISAARRAYWEGVSLSPSSGWPHAQLMIIFVTQDNTVGALAHCLASGTVSEPFERYRQNYALLSRRIQERVDSEGETARSDFGKTSQSFCLVVVYLLEAARRPTSETPLMTNRDHGVRTPSARTKKLAMQMLRKPDLISPHASIKHIAQILVHALSRVQLQMVSNPQQQLIHAQICLDHPVALLIKVVGCFLSGILTQTKHKMSNGELDVAGPLAHAFADFLVAILRIPGFDISQLQRLCTSELDVTGSAVRSARSKSDEFDEMHEFRSELQKRVDILLRSTNASVELTCYAEVFLSRVVVEANLRRELKLEHLVSSVLVDVPSFVDVDAGVMEREVRNCVLWSGVLRLEATLRLWSPFNVLGTKRRCGAESVDVVSPERPSKVQRYALLQFEAAELGVSSDTEDRERAGQPVPAGNQLESGRWSTMCKQTRNPFLMGTPVLSNPTGERIGHEDSNGEEVESKSNV